MKLIYPKLSMIKKTETICRCMELVKKGEIVYTNYTYACQIRFKRTSWFICEKKIFLSLFNLQEGAKRPQPEGAETVVGEELSDNVYDIAEFDENNVAKHDRVVPLGESPPSHEIHLTSACNLKANEVTSASSISTISSDHCLIENEGEKTIIFTSAAVAANSSQLKISKESKRSAVNTSTPEHQILISSSSWIDLQGGTKSG